MAKIRVTFKDPDAIYEGVREYVEEIVDNFNGNGTEVIEEIVQKISESKYVEFGEYITVEFDTYNNTARLIGYK